MEENDNIVTRGGTAPTWVRDSNIELFRIITMLLIVAHHFVVNSGLAAVDGPIYSDPTSWRSLFLLIFGAWGKTGINCFVFITGYFLCTSNINLRKFVKLLGEVMFYRIVIWCIFWLTGYEHFSLTQFVYALIPVRTIKTSFTPAFLVFYLAIPFLNILIRSMNEKQHRYLLLLCGFVYVFLGTIPFHFEVRMNYFSWFIVIYLIASYIRVYLKPFCCERQIYSLIFFAIFTVCVASIIGVAWIDAIKKKQNPQFFLSAYMFLQDSNTFLAVAMGVSAFLLFKNMSVRNNRLINMIASSTFGVLLIHAHSDTMRRWLWTDTLACAEHYDDLWMPIYAIACVLMVFFICVFIDQLRIRFIEKPFMALWDLWWPDRKNQ